MTISPDRTCVYYELLKVQMCVMLTQERPKDMAGVTSRHCWLSPDQRQMEMKGHLGHMTTDFTKRSCFRWGGGGVGTYEAGGKASSHLTDRPCQDEERQQLAEERKMRGRKIFSTWMPEGSCKTRIRGHACSAQKSPVTKRRKVNVSRGVGTLVAADTAGGGGDYKTVRPPGENHFLKRPNTDLP